MQSINIILRKMIILTNSEQKFLLNLTQKYIFTSFSAALKVPRKNFNGNFGAENFLGSTIKDLAP